LCIRVALPRLSAELPIDLAAPGRAVAVPAVPLDKSVIRVGGLYVAYDIGSGVARTAALVAFMDLLGGQGSDSG
jgi:hypothetical protein